MSRVVRMDERSGPAAGRAAGFVCSLSFPLLSLLFAGCDQGGSAQASAGSAGIELAGATSNGGAT
ncbi:MAG: hypothetical protein ABIQ16_24730, partial [Polyangiaceae bacterium]